MFQLWKVFLGHDTKDEIKKYLLGKLPKGLTVSGQEDAALSGVMNNTIRIARLKLLFMAAHWYLTIIVTS